MSRIGRQLKLYHYIKTSVYHGPSELTRRFGMGLRMLQRDLKDLRDCGLLFLRYDKKTDNYIKTEAPASFDARGIKARRKQHLDRLFRLGTLMDSLSETDIEELTHYESLVDEYQLYLEYSKEDPAEFPAENIGEPPQKPEFADIRKEYYELFPEGNERTRARDFAVLTDVGFTVRYSRRFKAFLVGPSIDPGDKRHWQSRSDNE